jgi:hypothetical protein
MRFDSKFFLARQHSAEVTGGRWPLLSVREAFGNTVRLPNIFERVPARSKVFGKPILVPYDCFRYLPYSNTLLSRSQVPTYDDLELKRGWLLIVRSGRNLGPVVMVDKFLEKFALSHDMIRICVEPSEELFYFAAVMHTRLGQILIRRDRNGSVIDHLDDEQVSSLKYPLVERRLRQRCSHAFERAFALRETGRMMLQKLAERFLIVAGLAEYKQALTQKDLSRRFTTLRSSIRDRFDAEAFAPSYGAYRRLIENNGHATPVFEIAHVIKPVGRYKTLYVAGEDFGVKLLSGRQIAQMRPIGLKIMSRNAWKKPSEYLLSEGMVLLTSDGRAEENLADCAMVRRDRAGWAASGHVHRLIAKDGIHPGLLYLACACEPVQACLKSLATGSVVDALSVPDVESVIVPFPRGHEAQELGDLTFEAWDCFADATELENNAISELEQEFSSNKNELSRSAVNVNHMNDM